VLVSSFSLPVLDRLRDVAPYVPTALLTLVGDPLASLAVTAAHGHAALHPSLTQLNAQVLDQVCDRARRRRIALNVWTVNRPVDVVRLAAAGIDGILTDLPAVALLALGRAARAGAEGAMPMGTRCSRA
jgi:glycerophosphoryl diester phosphodiesterase